MFIIINNNTFFSFLLQPQKSPTVKKTCNILSNIPACQKYFQVSARIDDLNSFPVLVFEYFIT